MKSKYFKSLEEIIHEHRRRVIQKVLYHVMPEERMNLRTRKRWHI